MNFLQLKKDKQIRIINSALKHFALKGYKKASAMDIAKDAGISKAMVFHYFGSKKDMYVYLIYYAQDTLNELVDKYLDENTSDIFELVSQSTKGKIEACELHPFILSFIASVMKEKDPDVLEDVEKYTEETLKMVSEMANRHMDYSKFRDDVNIQTAMKILSLTSEGILARFSSYEVIAGEQVKEYEECILALRSILYKKEAL